MSTLEGEKKEKSKEEELEEKCTRLARKMKNAIINKTIKYDKDKEEFFKNNSIKILEWVDKNIARHLDNIDESTINGYFYIRDTEIFFVRKELHDYDSANGNVLIESVIGDDMDGFKIFIRDSERSFHNDNELLRYDQIMNEKIKLGIYELIGKYFNECYFTHRLERHVSYHGELIFLISFEKNLFCDS